MSNDRELEDWQRAWQSWNAQPVDWIRKSQRAHRCEAGLRASYWAALAFGAAVVALKWRFGLVSWFRLGVGVGLLLFGAAVMLYSAKQLRRSQQQLSASPHWLIDDLTLLHQRELDGWTKKHWLATVGALAALGAGVVLHRIVEAWTLRESLLGPLAILLAYVVALTVVAAVGIARVRILRRQLIELQRVRAEIAE